MAVGKLKTNDLKAVRLYNMGLTTRANSLLDAISTTVGIQAQQPNAAIMNAVIRASSDKHEFNQLAETESIVRTWGQRWTLQLFSHEDYNLVIGARKNEAIPKAYFLNQEKLVEEVAEKMVTSGIKHWDSNLMEAKFPMLKGTRNLKYVILQSLTRLGQGFYDASTTNTKWRYQIIEPNLLDVSSSLKKLILRYLKGFGPASIEDFTKWSGIKISTTRPIWQRVTSELFKYQGNGSDEILVNTYALTDNKLAQLTELMLAKPIIAARFDATMTGYGDKSWLFSEQQQQVMWSKNGILYAPIIDQGQLIGTWNNTIKGTKMAVEVKTWADRSAVLEQKLAASFVELSKQMLCELSGVKFETQAL